MRGVAPTVSSIAMYPESSAGDVGESAVGARLTPELAVGGVESCARRDEEPSMRLPSRLSVGAADGGVRKLFYPDLQRVRFEVSEFGRHYAAAAQFHFEGDAFVFPE